MDESSTGRIIPIRVHPGHTKVTSKKETHWNAAGFLAAAGNLFRFPAPHLAAGYDGNSSSIRSGNGLGRTLYFNEDVCCCMNSTPSSLLFLFLFFSSFPAPTPKPPQCMVRYGIVL